MAIEVSDLKEFATELTDKSDAYLSIFIEMAELMIDESVFGDSYDKALLSLSAHLAVRAGVTGGANGGGAITSERAGDLSRSFGAVETREDALNATAYGQMFIMLKDRTVTTPLCV